MARGGRGSHQVQKRPVDLTGIISIAEKDEIVSLVNFVTEKMAADIYSLFDTTKPTGESPENLENQFHCLSLDATHNSQAQPSKARPKSLSSGNRFPKKEPKAREANTEAFISSQLGELQKEAIAFFEKWQASVVQRFAEITVSTQPLTEVQPGRGRNGRSANRNRSGRGAAKTTNGRVDPVVTAGPSRAPTKYADATLAHCYSPIPNTLWPLPMERRKLLLHIVLLLLLSLNEYTANSHILLATVASSLNLTGEVCYSDEARVAQGLAKAASELSAEKAAAQKEENKLTKKWKFNLGGGPGGIAKLASPLLAVGVGTARAGYGLSPMAAASLLGVMSENALLMGSLFGFNTSKSLEKVIESFTREVQDFSFLRLEEKTVAEYMDPRQTVAAHRRLRIVLAVCGFVTDEADIVKPWQCLGQQVEVYSVRWETSSLLGLGLSLETVIRSIAWKTARAEIRSKTIFVCLKNSEWPYSLLKVSKILDNPWSVGMVRAEKVGVILADAIMRHKFQGERAVSLVGYSLAARAIYACLMVLAERRQFGLIDSVVMMGTPAPADSTVWLTLKSVVSGRLVNVYSDHDYLLGFLCRTSNIEFGIAGLQAIKQTKVVENYRVTKLDAGHLSYQSLTPQILHDIKWEDVVHC